MLKDPLPKVILLMRLVFLPVSTDAGGWDDPPRMLPKGLNADRLSVSFWIVVCFWIG